MRRTDQTVIPDARVRHLKDQLIRAKVYLGLSATRNNPHFIKELRLRMKETQRALGGASKDSELPRKYVSLSLSTGMSSNDFLSRRFMKP